MKNTLIAFEGFDKNSKIHRDKVLTWYGVPKVLFWFYSAEKIVKKWREK